MSEVNGPQQKEKVAKVRRKPERDSVLHPTFANVRHNSTGSEWLERQTQRGGFLQRQCACGTHTTGGGECNTCRQKREANFLQQTAINTTSEQAILSDRAEVLAPPDLGIVRDFSHIPVHTKNVQSKRTIQPNLITHDLPLISHPSRNNSTLIQRRVVAGRVSCHHYPPTYPIFNAINTTDPVGVLQAADSRAITMLNNTINELTNIRNRVISGDPPAWPLISDAIARGMRSRLRLNPDDPGVWTGTGPGTVELIIRWFTNIRNLLTSGAIRYTCLGNDCESGEWAYTLDGVPRRIHLCRPFWRDTQDNQALTLIHETAHLYYGLEDAGSGAGNANCLEEFMADANGVEIPSGFIEPCRAPAP